MGKAVSLSDNGIPVKRRQVLTPASSGAVKENFSTSVSSASWAFLHLLWFCPHSASAANTRTHNLSSYPPFSSPPFR
jgi:hypothetical protein